MISHSLRLCRDCIHHAHMRLTPARCRLPALSALALRLQLADPGLRLCHRQPGDDAQAQALARLFLLLESSLACLLLCSLLASARLAVSTSSSFRFAAVSGCISDSSSACPRGSTFCFKRTWHVGRLFQGELGVRLGFRLLLIRSHSKSGARVNVPSGCSFCGRLLLSTFGPQLLVDTRHSAPCSSLAGASCAASLSACITFSACYLSLCTLSSSLLLSADSEGFASVTVTRCSIICFMSVWVSMTRRS